MRGSPCQEHSTYEQYICCSNALHNGERQGGHEGGAQAIRPAQMHCQEALRARHMYSGIYNKVCIYTPVSSQGNAAYCGDSAYET